MIVSPNGAVDAPRNAVLRWRSSETATSYRVQVSDNSLFAPLTADTTVADTVLTMIPLAADTRFYWRVRGINQHGASDYSAAASFITGNQIVSVAEHGGVPSEFSLSQNYPNPFNPSTIIRYDVAATAHVTITIYDLLGRVVSRLVDGIQSPNTYTVQWRPSVQSSGTYLCRLEVKSQDGSTGYSSVRKLLYLP